MSSTILLLTVIGGVTLMSSYQVPKVIDKASARLHEKILENIFQAGQAQIMILAETARILDIESDYITLQSIIRKLSQQDKKISEVAVVDSEGMILAHNLNKFNRRKADRAFLKKIADVKKSMPHGRVRVQSCLGNKQQMGMKTPWANSHSCHGPGRWISFLLSVSYQSDHLSDVYLRYSLDTLDAEFQKAERQKLNTVSSIIEHTLLISLLFVALGGVLAVFQSFRISKPILALTKQADQIADGDLRARVHITSRDEIGRLGGRFNYMAERVVELMSETEKKAAEKASMEKELEVASAVQSTLVPDSNLARLTGIELAGFFKPAAFCGGDWWNFYPMKDGRVLIVIGDVTGHGVASAMISAVALGAVAALVREADKNLDLAAMLRYLNQIVYDTAKGSLVMTCFISVYNPHTQSRCFSNAGHNFPLLYQCASKSLSALVSRGKRLGVADPGTIEVHQTKLSPDDLLIWFTDGLIEGRNSSGKAFGERRLRNFISSKAFLSTADLRDSMVESALKFFGAVPQDDDITLVIGRIV